MLGCVLGSDHHKQAQQVLPLGLGPVCCCCLLPLLPRLGGAQALCALTTTSAAPPPCTHAASVDDSNINEYCSLDDKGKRKAPMTLGEKEQAFLEALSVGG